jgi:hypothetical protein
MAEALSRRRIRSRAFAGLEIVYYEEQMADGRLRYSTETDVAAGDRIVIDGRTPEDVEAKTEAALHVALYVRQAGLP